MHYAATIFLSSSLLFLVQPLVARLILPWFGGSAAVWTTCMLFFQVLLLAGYAYAHFLNEIRNKKLEGAIHTALLVLAVATLPIAPDPSWKPVGGEEPIGHIVRLLGVSVGLPYFLLASTSPLVQAWFGRARPGADPYRLFALSNAASLAALVGYPFVVEPNLAAGEQVTMWSWGFAAFAVLSAVIAWLTPAQPPATAREAMEKPSARTLGLWLALSATGSLLLLAVTNHVTQDVASVPLLWLGPLTLYLLTFIVTFSGRSWYRPEYLWIVVLAALGLLGWLIVEQDYRFNFPVQIGVSFTGLFVACLFCHGELYRLRPSAGSLTLFYLTVSAGGAIGGLLVAVVAPLVFDGYYELGVGLAAAAILAALRFKGLGRVPHYAALVAVAGVIGCAVFAASDYRKDVRVSTRSFYGVLRVKEYGTPGEPSHLRRLVHGAILHGEQYLFGDRRRSPTTYYGEESGIGAAIESRWDRPGIRVGVIGLGAGTIAVFGRPGDVYRFYEIDRRVMDLAKGEFTYLGDSPARVELVLGDARLTLEREAPQQLDVLAVDAFSGDAIPVHLITREALQAYLRHLKPDGIVAFHVSNRHLELIPVVARIAKEEGAVAQLITDDPPDDDPMQRSRTDWVLVSRDKAALERPEIASHDPQPAEDRPEWRTWTDDYSNLVQILK